MENLILLERKAIGAKTVKTRFKSGKTIINVISDFYGKKEFSEAFYSILKEKV